MHPRWSAASTDASFSSNKETASMCPYATASISGVLGGKKENQSSHSYKMAYCLSLLTYTEKSGSPAFLATPTHGPGSFPCIHMAPEWRLFVWNY